MQTSFFPNCLFFLRNLSLLRSHLMNWPAQLEISKKKQLISQNVQKQSNIIYHRFRNALPIGAVNCRICLISQCGQGAFIMIPVFVPCFGKIRHWCSTAAILRNNRSHVRNTNRISRKRIENTPYQAIKRRKTKGIYNSLFCTETPISVLN